MRTSEVGGWSPAPRSDNISKSDEKLVDSAGSSSACSSHAECHPVAREECMAVAGTMYLTGLLVAIANLDHKAAVNLVNATPSLALLG